MSKIYDILLFCQLSLQKADKSVFTLSGRCSRATPVFGSCFAIIGKSLLRLWGLAVASSVASRHKGAASKAQAVKGKKRLLLRCLVSKRAAPLTASRWPHCGTKEAAWRWLLQSRRGLLEPRREQAEIRDMGS